MPTDTATPGATPTPKVNNGQGSISGLFDVDVGPGLYSCIVRTDEDSTSLSVKSSAMCYTEFPAGVGAGEPPCNAQHSVSATPAPVVPGEGNCNGHTNPPPYSGLAPTKLVGAYCSAGPSCGTIPGTTTSVPSDSLYTVGCFADIGGSLGPNMVAVIQISSAKAQEPGGPVVGDVINGTWYLYFGQSDAACEAATNGTAPGALPAGIPTTLVRQNTNRVYCSIPGNCQITTSPGGCTDVQKLWQNKTGSATKCGDDPRNPFQPEGTSPDVSGSYDITFKGASLERDNYPSRHLYLRCKADIQQQPKDSNNHAPLTSRMLCYVDSPTITVNPDAAPGGVTACPPADPKYCGDGLPGAPPPGCSLPSGCATLAGQGAGCPALPCDVSQYQFAKVSARQTVMTGYLSNTTNHIVLTGCVWDQSGHAALGNVVINMLLDAHTGVGAGAAAFPYQSKAICLGPDGIYGTADDGAAAVTPILALHVWAVRQAPGPKTGATATFPFGCVKGGNGKYTNCRDSAGDGCPDKMKLQDNPSQGGLRDPLNRWDFFGPANPGVPHVQTVADIIRTVQQFAKNQGNAAYTIDTDRTALVGGNNWNLGPPDGQQTVADILAAIKQFHQGC